MATVVHESSTTRKRTVLYAVGSAVLVLFVVAGLAFANSLSVTRVTDNARSLHWNNTAIGTAALTRAGLVQAVTFAELSGDGVVGADDLRFAIEQAGTAQGELEDLVEIGSNYRSHPALARFTASTSTMLSSFVDGDFASARAVLLADVEPAYVELTTALQAEQSLIQEAIEENSASGRALNNWVMFILTLGVPGSAVAVYFVVARRQVRAFKERSRIELEAEREVSRAKDSFIAGLSHELRTPLTSIYGFAEIMSEGGVQGVEATRETAQIIANESAEMTRMVDDLLAASRLDSTGLEIESVPTRLHDVIEAAAAPFERAGSSIDRAQTDLVVTTDASRLRHVIVNLLSNAIRHGGPRVAMEITTSDHSVDIEVIDNGAGVPEERLGSMFDRFAHAGDAPLLTGSVGLGLAVASRLTDLIGGTLRYQRYGGLTYFVLTLPAGSSEEEERDDSSVADMIRSLSS
jgi:signal transduction histidine kinase